MCWLKPKNNYTLKLVGRKKLYKKAYFLCKSKKRESKFTTIQNRYFDKKNKYIIINNL